jgi:hypothetical protein
MSKTIVTNHDKELIMKLAEEKVSSTIIAKVFNIPRQAVAAWKAWKTMKAK